MEKYKQERIFFIFGMLISALSFYFILNGIAGFLDRLSFGPFGEAFIGFLILSFGLMLIYEGTGESIKSTPVYSSEKTAFSKNEYYQFFELYLQKYRLIRKVPYSIILLEIFFFVLLIYENPPGINDFLVWIFKNPNDTQIYLISGALIFLLLVIIVNISQKDYNNTKKMFSEIFQLGLPTEITIISTEYDSDPENKNYKGQKELITVFILNDQEKILRTFNKDFIQLFINQKYFNILYLDKYSDLVVPIPLIENLNYLQTNQSMNKLSKDNK